MSGVIEKGPKQKSVSDTLPPVTTVGLRVVQFIARHKPFVAFGNVPKAAFHN